jgi:hypothetical protein
MLDGLVLLTVVPLGLLAAGAGAHVYARRARQRRLVALGEAKGLQVTQHGLLAAPTLTKTQGELTVVARHVRTRGAAETVDAVELHVRGLVVPERQAFSARQVSLADDDRTPVLPGFDVTCVEPDTVRGMVWTPEVQLARKNLALGQRDVIRLDVDALGLTLVLPQGEVPAATLPQLMQLVLDLAEALQHAADAPPRKDLPSTDGARGPGSGIPMAVRR